MIRTIRGSRRFARQVAGELRAQNGTLGILRDPRPGVLGAANLLDVMSVSIMVTLLPGDAEQLGAGPAFLGLLFAALAAAVDPRTTVVAIGPLWLLDTVGIGLGVRNRRGMEGETHGMETAT